MAANCRKKNEYKLDFRTGHGGFTPKYDLKTISVQYEALRSLGLRFYQRVFTAKRRSDPETGKIGPVLVGRAPHDFTLRVEGEDDHAHVEASGRTFRAEHKVVASSQNAKSRLAERREGIRTITGEPLPTPVAADMRGENQIDPANIPTSSSHAGMAAEDRGPCEEVDPIDAAIATSNSGLRVWIEARPGLGGLRQSDSPIAKELSAGDLKQMTETYNKEKHFDGEDQRTIIRGTQLPNGTIHAHVQESPNEARRRWQHEVSAKSFHGCIIGSARNHAQVTAYDVAIGSGKAASDPMFNAYLCAVADWRLKKPTKDDSLRQGILEWSKFIKKFKTHKKHIASAWF